MSRPGQLPSKPWNPLLAEYYRLSPETLEELRLHPELYWIEYRSYGCVRITLKEASNV